MANQFDFITIHCSATKASMDWGAKDIDREHRRRGFLSIGYHFVIKRDGTIETGRKLGQTGAHVQNHNKSNVGICLIGGLDKNGKPEDNYTDDQWQALKLLVLELKAKNPNVDIKGHRDWPNVAKACPCFDVKSWLIANGLT
jgi:N-acetyl-anhydromuramyl-L-alanine amidase AmpD